MDDDTRDERETLRRNKNLDSDKNKILPIDQDLNSDKTLPKNQDWPQEDQKGLRRNPHRSKGDWDDPDEFHESDWEDKTVIDIQDAKKKRARPKEEEKPKKNVNIQRTLLIATWLQDIYDIFKFETTTYFFHKKERKYHLQEADVFNEVYRLINRALKDPMAITDPVYDMDEKHIKKAMSIVAADADTKTVGGFCGVTDSPDKMYMHQFPYKIAEIATPVWDEMMGRMQNRDAFQAWIWSLFVDDSSRAQYPYLVGHGNEGKSTITKFLQMVLGDQASCQVQGTDRMKNRFWLSGASFNRLVIIPEADPQFMKSGVFKGLSGDDTMKSERKFLSDVTVELKMKFLFASNDMPDIDVNDADFRRIIYCPMKPIKKGKARQLSEVLRLLLDELPGILYRAQALYQKLLQPDGSIAPSYEKIEQVVTDKSETFSSIFDELFVVVDYETVPWASKKYSRLPRQEILSIYDKALINRKIPDIMTRVQFWQGLQSVLVMAGYTREQKVSGNRYYVGITTKESMENNQLGIFRTWQYYPSKDVDI